MYGLNHVEHALGRSRIPNESVVVAFSAQASWRRMNLHRAPINSARLAKQGHTRLI
jgi:hypothetical protein